MSQITTQLFLDVKKFEKYQEMLKKSVHIQEARSGEYDLKGFPNHRNFHRILRILGDHSTGVTNMDLIFEHDFKPSDVEDGVKALTSNNFATTEKISDDKYCIMLTKEGEKRAEALTKRREQIAEVAYGSLTEEEQIHLDQLINKLVENYEQRDVNYAGLSDLI